LTAALGAALAIAGPAAAQHGRGGGGGGGIHAGGGAHFGGGAAPRAMGGGMAVQGRSGAFVNRGGVVYNRGPGVANRNWSGRGWDGRHGGRYAGNGRVYHRRYIYGLGPGVAAGAYAAYPYYYGEQPYYYDDGDDAYDNDTYADDGDGYAPDTVAACAQRFQSYDVISQTYLGYDGLRHPCP
jgi:hypothetical protein